MDKITNSFEFKTNKYMKDTIIDYDIRINDVYLFRFYKYAIYQYKLAFAIIRNSPVFVID